MKKVHSPDLIKASASVLAVEQRLGLASHSRYDFLDTSFGELADAVEWLASITADESELTPEAADMIQRMSITGPGSADAGWILAADAVKNLRSLAKGGLLSEDDVRSLRKFIAFFKDFVAELKKTHKLRR